MSAPFLSVELDGPDLLAELTSIAGAIGPEITALNAEIGQAIEQAADGPTPVRTGALLRSIFWEADGPAGIVVSPHVPYAPFVHEYVPYMLMAYQIAEPTIDRILDRAGDRIVEAR